MEAAAGAAVLSWGSPLSASQAADDALSAVTKGAPVNKGRVALSIPAIAENGLSVFTTITVESPMTEADYVKAIHLISEKNPVPIVASFFFTPAMAEAKVIDSKAEMERRKLLAEAEADRIRVTAAADAERLKSEGAVLKQNPLLINKIVAERLSDKLQIMMVPADGKFFFANDVLRSMNVANHTSEADPEEPK